jgi:inorganic pyrophosphatase
LPDIVEVIIEVPRWSFVKRGPGGQIDFIAPLPCPFNYGSVPDYWGMDGDLLDAVVLGPRLARGTRLEVAVIGAIGLTDHDDYDDKLICSPKPITARESSNIELFFHAYALFKYGINFTRGYRGRNANEGWQKLEAVFSRATPRRVAVRSINA